MDRGKKKFSGSRETSKKGVPLGLVVALAVIGGVIIGSAGTYIFLKPLATATQSSIAPAAGGTSQAQTVTFPATSPQSPRTPASQPPGEAPPGKVWSAEHGHWHDIPATVTTPALAPITVTPATQTTPAPVSVPVEKKP
ncbi:MAG TPA: hypothetical protein VK530_20405 [Candidatus Acidoferrum sp.]|nr:hypothetical protein [Candidatus Acidoferrum sp.]